MNIEEELDMTIDEIYNDESNFNNADKTSGQRCRNKHEIAKELFDILYERLFK